MALTFGTHAPSGLPGIVHDGHLRVLGALPRQQKYTGPTWKDSMPVIPRDQWQEFDAGQFNVPIRDQDGHGSCTGSIAYALMMARALEGAPPQVLSGAYCYSWINGGQDNGGTIDDAANEIVQHGTCLQSTVGEQQIYRRQITASADTEAQRFKAASKIPVANFDEVVSALLLRWVVYFGTDVGRSFEPDGQGFLPDQNGSAGGHALYASPGLKKRGSKWYVRVPNSWGNWGVNGMCWMPESYFQDSRYGLGYALRPGADVSDDPQDPSVPPKAA